MTKSLPCSRHPSTPLTYEKVAVNVFFFPYGYDSPIRADLPMIFYLEPAPNQDDGTKYQSEVRADQLDHRYGSCY